MFGFLSGIANGYQGYQQGGDQELARQQLAKDRQNLELRQAQQGTLTDLQIKGAQRADAQAEKDQQYQAGKQALFGNSEFAKNQRDNATDDQAYQAATAKYKADMDAGDEGAMPPVAPTKRSYTPAQSVLDNLSLAAHDVANGKGDGAALMKLAEYRKNLDDEGYGRALKLAQSGAGIDQVAAEFNKGGKFKLDPKQVVSDTTVNKGAGVTSRVISFKGSDGQVHTIDTMGELDMLGQADKLFTRAFEGKKIEQGDQNIKIHQQGLNLQGGQLALAQNADKRSQTTFDEGASTREAAKAEADLRVELAGVDDATPEGAARSKIIQGKLLALKTGMRGVGAGHDPAVVKTAQALYAKGIYKTEAEALDSVTGKPDALFSANLQASSRLSSGDTAVQNAEKMMNASGWRRTTDGNHWTRTAVEPQFKPGETKTIASGPNKGKTAKYDGTGWVLSP